MRIPCFLIEPSGLQRIEASVWWGECAQDASRGIGHRFSKKIFEGSRAEVQALWNEKSFLDELLEPRCEYCGAEGGQRKATSAGTTLQWIISRGLRGEMRRDTAETAWRTQDFGVGAMYFADWYPFEERDGKRLYHGYWDNQHEPPLHVITPGGEWNIDSRARNCTLPNDRCHRCWVRHGTPPNVTVDKNGITCCAGAGSIVCGNYHGFLREGFLVNA